MISSSFEWNWQHPGTGGPVMVEVRVGMRTARDLRAMLLNAAYSLVGRDSATVLCLHFNNGFASRRLKREKEQFRTVVRENLAGRVAVHPLESPAELRDILPGMPSEDMAALEAEVTAAVAGKPRSSSQEAVVGTLLHRWIKQLPPLSLPDLASAAGASLPTVYSAIKTIEPSSLQRDDERRVSLAGFSAEAWQRWLSISTDRPVIRFTDHSGTPRSPEKLARQLDKLGRSDVAVGGVLGAKHHFPGLDVTAAPYLDLVLHGSPHADLSFIQQLDPGLVRDDASDAHAHVRLHVVNRPYSLFEEENGTVWADVLECMVNLWDAQLHHQVEHLIRHVAPDGLQGNIAD